MPTINAPKPPPALPTGRELTGRHLPEGFWLITNGARIANTSTGEPTPMVILEKTTGHL